MLATLVLLFAFQGKVIIDQPLIIALLVVKAVNSSRDWYQAGQA